MTPRQKVPAASAVVPKLRTRATLHQTLALRRIAFARGVRLADVHALLVREFLATLRALPADGRATRMQDVPEDGRAVDLRPGPELDARARASAAQLGVEIRAWAHTAIAEFVDKHGAAPAGPPRRRA